MFAMASRARLLGRGLGLLIFFLLFVLLLFVLLLLVLLLLVRLLLVLLLLVLLVLRLSFAPVCNIFGDCCCIPNSAGLGD